MTSKAKQRVMFISSREVAADFHRRCTNLSDDIDIATLRAFGNKPVAETFGTIDKIMQLGGLEWTIFHLPSVNEIIGATVFFEELKKLIKNGAIKRAHTAILDEEEMYNAEVRQILLKAGVQVVSDLRQLGVPFNRMLTPEEYEMQMAGEQNPAFAGMQPDYSNDGTRLPGMESTTPGSVAAVDNDPFSELDDAMTEDPFADLVSDAKSDPFTSMDGNAANMAYSTQPETSAQAQDPFAPTGDINEMTAAVADDFAGFDIEDGSINGEFDEDVLFDILKQDLGDGVGNADPFAGTAQSLENIPSGSEVFAQGDPFAELQDSMVAIDERLASHQTGDEGNSAAGNVQAQVDVRELMGGIGGVMSGSSVAEDVVGAAADPFAEADFAQVDPFAVDLTADSPQAGTSRNTGQQQPMDEDPFDFDMDFGNSSNAQGRLTGTEEDFAYDDGDLFADTGVFDPFGDFEDNDGYDDFDPDGEYDDLGALPSADGYDINDDGSMSHVLQSELLLRDQISLSDVLDAIGAKLSNDDYVKMSSMVEPVWDYSMEHADGIGQKGLFGKKSKGAISSSDEDELASSIYIRDMEEINGYYMPPTECKIIISTSCKGGSGKSIPNYCALQYIRNGVVSWGKISDIQPGDHVYNRLGQAVEVLQVFPQPEPLDVYRITLKDGRTIECSGDHLWNVLQRAGNRAKDHHRKVMTTKELMAQPLLKNEGKGKQEYRWKIPVAHAFEYSEKDLPVDPYLLGLLIGDGHLKHGVHISTSDMDIVDMIRKILSKEEYIVYKNRPHNDHDYDWLIRDRQIYESHGKTADEPLVKALDALGLYGKLTQDKFIPEAYLYASIDQRRALLQGLMDSDGTAHRGRIGFTTINRRLRDDFLQLARSLGYICSVTKDNRGWEKYTHTGECWTVHIQSNDVDNIFRLERKKQDLREYQSKQTKRPELPERGTIESYKDEAQLDDLPVDPYLFGLLLPRQMKVTNAMAKVTCRDEYIATAAINALPAGCALMPETIAQKTRKISPNAYLILDDEHVDSPHSKDASTRLKTALRSLYASGDIELTDKKHMLIPREYLRACPEARQALLQGIFDAVGIFAPSSRCLPSIFLNDPALEQQVRQLAASLGYEIKEPTNKDDKGRLIFATSDTSIFRSSLLKEEMLNYVSVNYGTGKDAWMSNDNEYISIVNIEKTGKKAEMTCLLVDDDEHMFVAGDFIVTHNTTVTVGLASQLNWYFNQKLMQRLSTNYNARVLVLSLNEFDDIPVHGVGYDTAFSQENDTDGKNVAELLRRIDETGGNPQWDDIMHCFVSTERNRVFYLPSLTTREILTNNISLTADDYKKVIECCKRFFQFVVIDTPDIFYQQKNDLMNFAYSIADIICMVIEPDTRSTVNLMHFFDGLKSETGRIPLPPEKCLLVVNKVVKDGNPYITLPPVDQIKFERITTMLADRYMRFVAIPFTQPRGTGNVLFGTDKHVKLAFAELADDVLEMIDANDIKAEAKKMAKARRH